MNNGAVQSRRLPGRKLLIAGAGISVTHRLAEQVCRPRWRGYALQGGVARLDEGARAGVGTDDPGQCHSSRFNRYAAHACKPASPILGPR